MSGYRIQTFDDRDTDHLKYQGDWILNGSYNASHVGETGTLSSTKDLTASVTFTFPVPAIAFYYYGIERCCGGLYGICIDCYPDRPNYVSIDALNRSDDGQNPPVVLYSMRFDIPGIHEIIIRNENDTRVVASGNSQLTIDRIDLEVVDDTSGTTTASPTVSTLFLSASSLFSRSQSASRTISDSSFIPMASLSTSISSSHSAASLSAPASSSSAGSESSHTFPIGSVVGGALGGGFVVVLILLLSFWFCLRQRRKAAANTGPPMSPSAYTSSAPSSTIVTPPMVIAQNSTTIPVTNVHYPGRYGYTLRPEKGAQVSVFPSSMPTLSESSSQIPSSTSSNRGRREQDAGPLPVDIEEPTLPPEYNQVFSHVIRSSNNPPG